MLNPGLGADEPGGETSMPCRAMPLEYAYRLSLGDGSSISRA